MDEEKLFWMKKRMDVVTDIVEKMDAVQEREIVRLRKYEKMVQFIANDYYELSHDKVKWQHNDWYKRCRKLIEEDQ